MEQGNNEPCNAAWCAIDEHRSMSPLDSAVALRCSTRCRQVRCEECWCPGIIGMDRCFTCNARTLGEQILLTRLRCLSGPVSRWCGRSCTALGILAGCGRTVAASTAAVRIPVNGLCCCLRLCTALLCGASIVLRCIAGICRCRLDN